MISYLVMQATIILLAERDMILSKAIQGMTN